MLVISRHKGEELIITGPCRIKIIRIGHGHPGMNIRIGITAPDETKIWRGELCDSEGNVKPLPFGRLET